MHLKFKIQTYKPSECATDVIKNNLPLPHSLFKTIILGINPDDSHNHEDDAEDTINNESLNICIDDELVTKS